MITYAMLILIIGAVVAISAQAFIRGKNGRSKAKTRKTLTFVGLAVVGLAVLFLAVPTLVPQVGQEIDLSTLSAGLSTGGEDSGTVDGKLCAVEDTTVTLSAINKYTSLAVGGTHRYRVNGGATKEVSDAGTFTASPGDTLSVLWLNGSTSSTYFSDVSTVTVPCKGTFPVTKELYQNGTVTIDVFNEEGNRIDSVATGLNNETLSAGDVTTLSAKLKGTFKTGQPYGGVIIADYNNSDFDDVIVDFGGDEVSVPSAYVLSGGRKAKAYSVPALLSNQIIEGTVTIDVDDTNNPSAVPVGAVNLTYYPSNYFINENTGGSFDGPAVEDEADVQTYSYSVLYDILVA